MTKVSKKEKIPMLMGLRALYSLINTALHIPFIAEEMPVGILIVSKPGMGKSMLLTRFRSDNIMPLSDCTGHGLEKTVIEMEGKERGYVIISDLLKIMSRKKSWDGFITLSNIILEEGLKSLRRADVNMVFKHPIRFGLITAITSDCLEQHYNEFVKVGFASRLGIFSYNYEQSDNARIENFISIKSVNEKMFYLVEPRSRKNPICDIVVSQEMGKYIKRLGKVLANGKHESFRPIVFIRRMVKAHAYIENRNEVTIEDIQEMFALVPFFVPPSTTSTDLEYLILKGYSDEAFKNLYTNKEIYEAHERLTKKRINWNMITNPAEDPPIEEIHNIDPPRNNNELF
jgi:hypothetical protein